MYHQTSNISPTLVGNRIVEHKDVVGASPVCTAPTTSSFLTTGFNGLRKDKGCTKRETSKFWDLVQLILEIWQYTNKDDIWNSHTDTAKLTGPRTFADKRWVGPVKLLCIIMFNISKNRRKSLLGPVKAQKFSRCLHTRHHTFHSCRQVMGCLLWAFR